MASISRAERLRALSKKARDDHAKLNAAPTPNPNLNFNNNSQLEDENSQLRLRMEHAEAEADDALAKATEAESGKSAALHQLEKYQLAMEHLQLRVAELELEGAQKEYDADETSSATQNSNSNTTNYPTPSETKRSNKKYHSNRKPPPTKSSLLRQKITSDNYQGRNNSTNDIYQNSKNNSFATPSSSKPQRRNSAMDLITSNQTVIKTPTLYLAGKRRRHGESFYRNGSKTTVNSDTYNNRTEKNELTHQKCLIGRPRFNTSNNYHDPNDPHNDYSQSRSSSRMELLDRSQSMTSNRPSDQLEPTTMNEMIEIKDNIDKGTSLYHAALRSSPMKEIKPSDREMHSRLSHTGSSIKRSMPEGDKPHLQNFHRRADEVLGDRHSYQLVHNGLQATAVFQSVKNKRMGLKAHGLKHVEHAKNVHRQKKGSSHHRTRSQVQGDMSQLASKTNDPIMSDGVQSFLGISNIDTNTGGGTGSGGVVKKKTVESPRNKMCHTASSGRNTKGTKHEMVFGRRVNSTFKRDSHLHMHQGLTSRDYMGDNYTGTQPTYTHTLYQHGAVEGVSDSARQTSTFQKRRRKGMQVGSANIKPKQKFDRYADSDRGTRHNSAPKHITKHVRHCSTSNVTKMSPKNTSKKAL